MVTVMGHPGQCGEGDGALLTPLVCVLLPQFDPGNTGYISTCKFRSLLESQSSKLDPHKREVLLALADSHADGQICYQDFVNLVSALGPSPLGEACLGVWLRGSFWIINGICWSAALKKSRLQQVKGNHQRPNFSLSVSSAFYSVSSTQKSPRQFQTLPSWQQSGCGCSSPHSLRPHHAGEERDFSCGSSHVRPGISFLQLA